MGREVIDPVKELAAIKKQLAQLAYDIFTIHLFKDKEDVENASLSFDELNNTYRHAWTEAVWAAVEAGKGKALPLTDSLSKKEQDNGYLLYNSCKELKKKHSNLFTYSKFPDHIKNEYRTLARKIYEKIDVEEEGEGET